MISESELERYIQPILERQYEINNFVIGKIAQRIKEIGEVKVSDLHKLESLYKMGADARAINAEIARLTGLNIQDIKSMIRTVAMLDYADTRPFYDYRHKPFIPFAQNKQLLRYVNVMANQTALQYKNISKAQGFMIRDSQTNKLKMTSISKTYQQVVDRAIQATSQGTVDYNTAMRNTIKELVDSGLRRIEYNPESGRSYTQRMDSAVRRNILDGVRAMNQGMQDIVGQQFGANGKEMSVHMNPALDHEHLQGHIYSNEEFEKMQSAEDFEDVDGVQYEAIERAIGTLNCRHFMYSIIIGVNKPNYTKEQLQAIIERNHEGYTNAKGKHMTMYDCTQYQRQLETKVRYMKDGVMAAKEAGNTELAQWYQARVDRYRNQYEQFSKACGLGMKKSKMTVSGYRRVSMKKGA